MNKFLGFLLFLLSMRLMGQDPQFSQYYNAPLYLNPAMTGATECYRVGANARTQWLGLTGSFNTGAVYADMNFNDLRSGFGIMFLRDVIGTSRLSSNEISGLYSYLVSFSDQINLRMGLQGTYVNRAINYDKAIFEDQYTGIVVANPTSSDPILNFTTKKYFDFSSGFLLYGENSYWLGVSAHHLNQPEQSFMGSGSKLPMKISVQGGYNFLFNRTKGSFKEETARVIPTFMYKSQSKFDQADLGLYYTRNKFLFGMWYRGIFFKQDEKLVNNDAIIVQAGVKINTFSFTYSFDFTTSRLSMINTSGSHEISVVYLFCADWPPRKKPIRKRLPCPDFQKSIR